MSGDQQEFFETRTAAKPDLVFVRSLRARHYRLTLRKDGVAVATVPARGSEREARVFVEQHRDWLERARARQARRPRLAETWTVGTHVLWRGEMAEIRRASEGERPTVCVAADVFRVPGFAGDLRPTLEAQFARRAKIELPARYVLVLLDLTMPHMDGEETFRQLRHLNPGVKVVLMSGFNQQEAVSRFTGKGLAGFVQKPFSVDGITAAVREVLLQS